MLDQWVRIHGHLARAWVELPSGVNAELDLYNECLEHDE
jgi:hypothetical protein